MYTNIQKKF